MKKVSISLSTLLTVLFVGLKLTGHIAWSWWLVTLPLWGGVVLALLVWAIVALVLGVVIMKSFK